MTELAAVLKHPLVSTLIALCLFLGVSLGFSALRERGLSNRLDAMTKAYSADESKLADLATLSATRVAAAKATAATALKLAQSYRVRAQSIQATVLPAGADRCAAASALITQETK